MERKPRTEMKSCTCQYCKKALVGPQIASNLKELTQERSHIHAGIVERPLATRQFASDMNELTQE